MNRIFWNFGWATVYNLVAIPMAAGMFYPFTKQMISPIVAAAASGITAVIGACLAYVVSLIQVITSAGYS